jgi:hypothetical protein
VDWADMKVEEAYEADAKRRFRVQCEGSVTYARPPCGIVGENLRKDDAEMLARSHGVAKGHKCLLQEYHP